MRWTNPGAIIENTIRANQLKAFFENLGQKECLLDLGCGPRPHFSIYQPYFSKTIGADLADSPFPKKEIDISKREDLYKKYVSQTWNYDDILAFMRAGFYVPSVTAVSPWNFSDVDKRKGNFLTIIDPVTGLTTFYPTRFGESVDQLKSLPELAKNYKDIVVSVFSSPMDFYYED